MKSLDSNRTARVLIFGPSGHGKTHLLGTLAEDPRTSPVLFLDYEGGTTSLMGKGFLLAERPDDIKGYKGTESVVYPIQDLDDFSSAYTALVTKPTSFKSIAMDSGTEAQLMALLLRLKDDSRFRRNPDALDENDWGIVLTQMRRIVREFRNLPFHFFMTALAKEDTDVREGRVKKPAFSGSFLDEAPGMFECVGYLALAETKTADGERVTNRILLLQNHGKIRTKVRLPDGVTAPDELYSPTMTDLLDVLQISS